MNSIRLLLRFWEPNERKFYTVTINNPVPDLEEEDLEIEKQKLVGVLVPATCQPDEAVYVTTTRDEVMNLIPEN